MPQTMTEFSTACRGNRGFWECSLSDITSIFYWVFLDQIKWPSRALGKLSSWLGLTQRVSKSLDGGGQASNSLGTHDTLENGEVTGLPEAGNGWFWAENWAQALHGPVPLHCSLSCWSAWEFVAAYSAVDTEHAEVHTERKWRARMEKELQLQAQPEINKLSTPVPRQAGYGDWKLILETPQA